MGISDQNNDIAKAIEDLATYGEVTKAATNITREGITEMRSKLEEMERIAGEVRKDVADAVAVTADVALGLKKPAEKAKVVADDEENPFKL
jgi:archaellum component FlaC